MFRSGECVNGLAHGQGLVVSLDGDLIVPNAQVELGTIVQANYLALPSETQFNPPPDGG